MIEKPVLQEMYVQRKMSVAEIATELRATFPKVLYWVRKHGIPIRSCSERTYVKRNSGGDPFHPKERLNLQERELLLVGLAIYWAEGSRKVRHSVKVVNMDYRMLQIFARFLREIARVDESRLRLDVRVYHGFDRDAARQYWSKLLKMRPAQVFVYPHIDHRSTPDKQWSPYGIATLSASNTKFKAWMDQQLEETVGKLLSRAGAVKEKTATYTYA